MIPSFVFTWWLTLLLPPAAADPTILVVKADVTVEARTVGLARQEVQFACTRDLDAQCYDAGRDRVIEPCVGGPQCDEDETGWATCTVACSGSCSDRPADGE